MNKPQVSVVMPAFNAERYIDEAIQSVIDQTFKNWELIIINDGSTDSTRSIAERHALNDARIKLINQKNKKQGAARNTGVINANGEWIAFLDADDLWVPLKLEKQLEAAKANPQAGILFTDGYKFTDTIHNCVPYGIATGFFEASAMYKLEYQGNYIPVLSVLVKKKYLNEIGLQDESPFMQGCEDWDYWLRLAIHGIPFLGMEEKLFYYRRHATNVSNDDYLMTFAKAIVLIKNLREDLLSLAEIKKMNGFINLTVCNFLKIEKPREALFLNDKMNHVFHTKFRKISSSLIRIFKSRSYLMVRTVYKVNSLLNPIKITQ